MEPTVTGIEHAVRVAVVGCGAWGRNLVRTHAALGSLAAVVDASPDAARAQAEAHGVAARSFDEVLDDTAIGAVVIAAPATDHAELAHRAITADKHVFVEKPLALTVADAEWVVKAAEAHGRTLMVGHLLQYHPAFLALKALVADGALGQLRYLYSNRLNLGRIRQEENSLWSFAPHDLSMILSLVGEEPDEVLATGSSFLNRGVADVTTTHLSFPGGARAHVFVSWLHPFKEQRLVVVGSDAMAVFDDTLGWDHKLVVFEHAVDWVDGVPTPARAEPTAIPLEATEPLRLEGEHFLSAVASGTPPRTDGAEGLRVLRVLARAQESLAEAEAGATPMSPGVEDTADPATGPPEVAASAVDSSAVVHETAVVDAGVTVGPGTKVWHFSHLMSGTVIGADCTLGQNVVVGPDVVVGDRCRIQNNVSVYAGVTLSDGVFCGPSSVFTNVYNPRADVSRKDEFRSTMVREGATIGANATIVCGNEIGTYAFVGAGALVNRPVPAHALVVGTPARRIGWMSHDGERLGDDLMCPRSGRRYELDGDGLREVVEPGGPGPADEPRAGR